MKKAIKVALLDFDGTLVTHDILDLLAGVMGKEQESRELNEAFHQGELPGVTSLIARINLLAGLRVVQIKQMLLSNAYLRPGTIELMGYFRRHEIMTILASGNIEPVLNYYQNLLGIDYIVGPKPRMRNGVVLGIDESAFSSPTHKLDGINKILKQRNFRKENILAIGDSAGDKGMFQMAGLAIAVDPKGNIAEWVDIVVDDDLREVVKILEEV